MWPSLFSVTGSKGHTETQNSASTGGPSGQLTTTVSMMAGSVRLRVKGISLRLRSVCVGWGRGPVEKQSPSTYQT